MTVLFGGFFMEKSARKSFLLQSLKAGLLSLVFACVGVLLLALFAKLFSISDGALPIINQVLKALAVALGMLLSLKEDKFLLKAVVGAVLYWVLSFVLFSLLGGAFRWGQIGLDLAIALAVSIIVALIKTRKA